MAATQPSAGSAKSLRRLLGVLPAMGKEPPLASRPDYAHLWSMARKNIANSFAAYAWFAEAGWVFAMHSAQLWADPARASARLAALGVEKQKAFAEGAMKATAAAMRGAAPDTIARVAMAPARRRVRANARKIQKG